MSTFLFSEIENTSFSNAKNFIAESIKSYKALLKESLGEFEACIHHSQGKQFILEFPKGRCVEAAIEIQKRMYQKSRGVFSEIKIQMAIHPGDPNDDKTNDLIQDGLNILSAVRGGQILISQEALVVCAIPNTARAVNKGKHFLKDLSGDRNLFAIESPELPYQRFGPLRTLSFYKNNFTVQKGRFVGRKKEMRMLSEVLIFSDYKIISLVGNAGVGKKRLALQAAAINIEKFSSGIFYINFSCVNSINEAVYEVCRQISFVLKKNLEPIEQLFAHLRNEDILLVFDKYSHLCEQDQFYRKFLFKLVEETNKVKIIAVGREATGHHQEYVFTLNKLVSGDDHHSVHNLAEKLFWENIRVVNKSFNLDEKSILIIRDICKLLDGIPLAIELTASLARNHSLDAILQDIKVYQKKIGDQQGDDSKSTRNLILRSIFELVYSQMNPNEHLVYLKLSLFQAGFTLDGAARVAQASSMFIERMVHKGLVKQIDKDRYEINHVFKRISNDKLKELHAEDQKNIRRNYAVYFGQFLTDFKYDIRGGSQSEILKKIDLEYFNVLEAWKIGIETLDLHALEEYIFILFDYFELKNFFIQGVDVLELAKKRVVSETDTFFKAKILARQGALFYRIEHYQDALKALEEANSIFASVMMSYQNAIHDIPKHKEEHLYFELARGHGHYGECNRLIGNNDIATEHLNKSLEYFNTVQDDVGRAWMYSVKGIMAEDDSNLDDAAEYYRKSLSHFKFANDPMGILWANLNLAICLYRQGQHQKAEEYFKEEIDLYERMEQKSSHALSLKMFGELELNSGQYKSALHHLERCRNVYRNIEDRVGECETSFLIGTIKYNMGEVNSAMNIFKNCLYMFKENLNEKGVLNCFRYLAKGYLYLGEKETADSFYEECFGLLEKHNDKHILAAVHFDRGYYAIQSDDFKEASDSIEKAYEYALTLRDEVGIANAYNHLGLLNLTNGELNLAQDYLKRALNIFSGLEHYHGIIEAKLYLSQLHLLEEDYYEATSLVREVLEKSNMIGVAPEILKSFNVITKLLLSLKDEERAKDALIFACQNSLVDSKLKEKYIETLRELDLPENQIDSIVEQEIEQAKLFEKALYYLNFC